jgi:cytochrome c oxidase subunit 4
MAPADRSSAMADAHATTAPEPHGPTASQGHATEHATVQTYWIVAAVLAIITAIELACLYVPGVPNVVLVLGLLLMSAAKFVLVVGFFMHLRYDSPVFRTMFVGPLLIAIGIILALMGLFSAFILLPRPVL